MAPAVCAAGLTKLYGSARGVLDLDLVVERGEIFGFLGPNGAGKTTTIRMMLDLIRPTRGTLELLGLDTRRQGVELRRRVGYLPGDLRLYDRLTGRELLRFVASVRELDGLGDAPSLAERLDLDLERPLKALSRGNRQKVGLVQAFLHRPDLLVLDEPTSGLDPLAQQTFAELVREAVGRGATVFLSSHDLAEVQRLADRVGVVREGRLVLVEGVEQLRERAPARIEARFAEPPPADAFAAVPGVRVRERRDDVVSFVLEGEVDPLLKALARFHVVALDSHEADLEDVFLALYGEGQQDA